ncbi:hypothetical protein NM962_01350 [Mycobacterium sp. SVM_VP21]|nr:hypothetical protein NM962_01350 [Mycobacterium sp. SVM_VP21]
MPPDSGVSCDQFDVLSKTLAEIREHVADLADQGATPEMLARSVTWLRHEADTAPGIDHQLYRTIADTIELEIAALQRRQPAQ